MMRPWKLMVIVVVLALVQIGNVAFAVETASDDDRFLLLFAGVGFLFILAIKALAFETRNTWQARTMRREWWGE